MATEEGAVGEGGEVGEEKGEEEAEEDVVELVAREPWVVAGEHRHSRGAPAETLGFEEGNGDGGI